MKNKELRKRLYAILRVLYLEAKEVGTITKEKPYPYEQPYLDAELDNIITLFGEFEKEQSLDGGKDE